MLKSDISEQLKSVGNIRITKILKQHWKERKSSYLSSSRPDFGIMLVLSGETNFVTSAGSLSAQAGNIVFLPKGSKYEAFFNNETDDYLVNFDMDNFSSDVCAPVKLLEEASLSSVEAFSSLVEENYSENYSNLRIQGLLYLLFDVIVNDIEAEAAENKNMINRVCDLLSRDVSVSFGDIAKECAISESGLRRIFKERVGVTPIQYRTETKLKQSIYLLESTDLSVSEIAEKLGFFDAAYFCKVFRLRFGITPKQYVKSKRL